MKLFTKDINNKLFKQFQSGNDLDNQRVIAKIFNPYGKGRWFLVNSDPQDPDYLWAIVQMGDIVEVGSVLRSELESIRVSPFRFPLERDLGFSEVNAGELLRGLDKGKFYKEGGSVEYAGGGMTAGRWYRDNTGVEYRYIGENSQGQLLFNDGEKIITRMEEDFTSAPKEKKLFGFFEDGGITMDDYGTNDDRWFLTENGIVLKSKLTEPAANKLVEVLAKSNPDKKYSAIFIEDYESDDEYAKGGETFKKEKFVSTPIKEGDIFYDKPNAKSGYYNYRLVKKINGATTTVVIADTFAGRTEQKGAPYEEKTSYVQKIVDDANEEIFNKEQKIKEDVYTLGKKIGLYKLKGGNLMLPKVRSELYSVLNKLADNVGNVKDSSVGAAPNSMTFSASQSGSAISVSTNNVHRGGNYSGDIYYLVQVKIGGALPSDKKNALKIILNSILSKFEFTDGLGTSRVRDTDGTNWSSVMLTAPTKDGYHSTFNALDELKSIRSLKDGGKMADGGQVLNNNLNIEVKKMAIAKGLTPKELGRDYELNMSQAVVAGLTDANYHTAVKKLVSTLEKKPWSEELYKSKYYNASDKIDEFGRKVAAKAEWDGFDVANAFEYVLKMNGFSPLAAKINKAMQEDDNMAKGGKLDTYEVELAAAPNVDYDEDNYNGYVNIKKHKKKVSSIDEAILVVRNFISENDLGGGNWTGGDVYKDGKKIGAISYNGRYWEGGYMDKGGYMNDGGDLESFEKKVKDAMKHPNKWYFIADYVGDKKVQLKMFVGVKEVDVQIFKIDGLHAKMPRNYSGRRDTLKMIMDNFEPKMVKGGEMVRNASMEGFSVGDKVKYKGKRSKYMATVLKVVYDENLPYAEIKWDGNGKVEDAYLDDLVKLELRVAEEYVNPNYMAKGGLIKIGVSDIEDSDFQSLSQIFESNDAAFSIDESEEYVLMDLKGLPDGDEKEEAMEIIGKYDVQKMAKGGDLYDDMDEDIKFANKKVRMVAKSLDGLGFNVLEINDADYDTNANIVLSKDTNVDVGLDGEISIVIDKGDGKFLFIDCKKSYATLLQKLKDVDPKYLPKRNGVDSIKLTLSKKDSYDYIYTQDGTKNSITFAFGKGAFQFDVKKISPELEKYEQDILDAFVIQGIKQHDYKGGFTEAIQHLDTKVVQEANNNLESGGELDWGEDLGDGFSVGSDVYINDRNSRFYDRTGYVIGKLGQSLVIRVGDDEMDAVVRKNGVERLEAPEFAKGGNVNSDLSDKELKDLVERLSKEKTLDKREDYALMKAKYMLEKRDSSTKMVDGGMVTLYDDYDKSAGYIIEKGNKYWTGKNWSDIKAYAESYKTKQEAEKKLKSTKMAKGGKIQDYLSSRKEMYDDFDNALTKKDIIEFIKLSKDSDSKYYIRDSNKFSKFLYKGQLRANDSVEGIFKATKIGVDRLDDALKYKIQEEELFGYEKEQIPYLDQYQNLKEIPKKSINKDWSKYVNDNNGYLSVDEETEDTIKLSTRKNGNVGDEEYSPKDVQEAKDVYNKIKEKYPNTKGKLYNVDEWVYLELTYNDKMAKGGMMEHGLRIGDKVTTDMFWDNQIVVENTKTHKRAQIDLETGKRKDEMAKGGKVTFQDKVKSIKASLLKTKKVPKKVQKDYGKTYNVKEAELAAKRIAGSMRKKGMK